MKKKIKQWPFLFIMSLWLISCSSVGSKKVRLNNAPVISNEDSSKSIALQKKSGRESILGQDLILTEENTSKPLFSLEGGSHLQLQNTSFDFPVTYNRKVEKWINYFLTRGRGFFERYSQRASQFGPLILEIIKDFGLPQDLIFLAMAESGFNNIAKSKAKAVGIWQFMPSTGRQFGLKINWFIDERRDPIKSTIAACRYLDYLYKKFGSWELASAAYNAGEGKVSRAIKRYRTKDFWKLSKGRYLKRETKNYVPKIMALAIVGKNLKSFGFGNLSFFDPFDFEEVMVSPNTDLFLLSKELGVSFALLKEYNPELLRWQTPLDKKMYRLRLPVGKKKLWRKCCLGSELLAKDYQIYRVRRKNSTLRDVAKVFRLDPKLLKRLNEYSIYRKLKVGGQVILPFKVGQNRRESMYSDLYERSRKRSRRKRISLLKRIRIAKIRGKRILRPTRYYKVKRGDTLWKISNVTGTSLDTLIVSNVKILENRKIREGDRLIIR